MDRRILRLIPGIVLGIGCTSTYQRCPANWRYCESYQVQSDTYCPGRDHCYTGDTREVCASWVCVAPETDKASPETVRRVDEALRNRVVDTP